MKLLIQLPAIISLLLIISCDSNEKLYRHSFFRMDTIIDVTITNGKKYDTKSLWNAVDSILQDWDGRFSVTKENSEVKKVNERLHDTVAVSHDLGEMIRIARNYGDSLDGGFDYTILPLKKLWGLAEDSPENQPFPTQAQIDSVRACIDYKKVNVSAGCDTLIFLSPQIKIDVGGVAKGFALMKIAKFLRKNSIKNFLVNGGGDIIGEGKKPDGKEWVIGIQHPRKSDNLLTAFKIGCGSIFTSGDYERYRDINGQRIHHLFNPHTGCSATKNQSVTIYGPDPLQNKFLSTGLFALNADSIVAYVNNRPQIDCIVVDSLGNAHLSKRWKNSLKVTE